jgi:hypothetical protein
VASFRKQSETAFNFIFRCTKADISIKHTTCYQKDYFGAPEYASIINL